MSKTSRLEWIWSSKIVPRQTLELRAKYTGNLENAELGNVAKCQVRITLFFLQYMHPLFRRSSTLQYKYE